MDTVHLTAFLELARNLAQQSKISEQAAIIVCLVLVLAMISLLLLLLSWLRIIICLVLFFRITQMYAGPAKGGVQALLRGYKTGVAQLQNGQLTEASVSDTLDILAGHQDVLMPRPVSRES
ncbi:hypothetical protein MMC11_007571 [Xylographa trunciseda]|nr:hypothetical protein [Xylographa trunciseda]